MQKLTKKLIVKVQMDALFQSYQEGKISFDKLIDLCFKLFKVI